ncbi:MAG: glycosyltransferase family 4 protein, partial [Candidatus Zixiibacteriota bacterium]
DNIVVIPPGVDVHTFCPQKTDEKQIKTNLPDKYILCLSRIDTNKGHDLLLNAFKHVKDEVPDIQLVIAGGSAKPQTRELEVIATMNNIITRKKMTDRVHIVGYVPDELLVPYYQQAKLFVLPSVFEPFGMTALEAMACSTPVVASKFGGIRNVITSGENGLLVDAHNQGEFAEAMIRLLKDQSLAEKMGKDGYRTIIDSYSWEAIAERHLNFYNKYIKICSVQA